ncbi:MAG: hypothetical protein WCC58_09315, partial [Burkholderiales bacterium]
IQAIPAKRVMHVLLTVMLTVGAAAAAPGASPIANLEPNSRMAVAGGRAEQLCWHHGMGPALACDQNTDSPSPEMAIESDREENLMTGTSQIEFPDFLRERLVMHLGATPCPMVQHETSRATGF